MIGGHIVFALSVCPSVRPSVRPHNFNLAFKMHILLRIFLKLGMHVARDEFYTLSNFASRQGAGRGHLEVTR